jgi:hypothetical protein
MQAPVEPGYDAKHLRYFKGIAWVDVRPKRSKSLDDLSMRVLRTCYNIRIKQEAKKLNAALKEVLDLFFGIPPASHQQEEEVEWTEKLLTASQTIPMRSSEEKYIARSYKKPTVIPFIDCYDE